MKLGISYMLFDGEELLEFALKSIRKNIDHISVTYQTTSYFGNPAGPDLIPLLKRLENDNLIDELIHYEPNLSITPKENELKLRNLGLNASRKAECTHHISADVDEFYDPQQLESAKKIMEEGDYDFSVAYLDTYYKHPTFLISPDQKLFVSFIHPVNNEYNANPIFPFQIETTRKFINCKKYRIFSREEFVIHHMSYIRKDIRKKFQNSDNGRCYKIDKFVEKFNTYSVGERVCLIPDFMNRKTVLVDNKFNIHF